LDLGKIKISYLQKHLIFYGNVYKDKVANYSLEKS